VTTDSKTGADQLAQALAEAGIRHAFGIPGGEVLAFVQALNTAGIATHLVRHENAGGFMAEGVWHGSKAPGLLYATLGPGVANAVNVIANAEQDRVPLIFVTGAVDTEDGERYTHQVFDHQALLRPIVKGSFKATRETCRLVAQKAISLALSGRPGPVHIDLPISVAEGAAGKEPAYHQPAPSPMRPAEGPDLNAARTLVAKAARPIILAGLDVVNQHAGPALLRFAEALNAPVITTYKAKGVIDEDHLLVISAAGLSPKADRHLLPIFAEADLIILAGYDPIEMRANWKNPWPLDKPVIDISAEMKLHGMHAAQMSFIGDVGATLEALMPPGKQPVAASWAESTRQKVREAFEPVRAWGPEVVFATLRKVMPKDAVATVDSGAHRILLSQTWVCHQTRGTLQSTGLCTMACAVPLAAGYKMARRDTPVIAFVGDAGLEMGLGELATLRDLDLPILICVLVDDSLSLIEMKQRSSQRPNSSVDFGSTDYPALARALGGHGVWIEDAKTLAKEAETALSRPSFTLLACRIGRRAYDGLF
jgi:acetolactate synthase I/II/III large subunit